jgi:DNA-directed RNA polymerase subunit RPC12/RpoP
MQLVVAKCENCGAALRIDPGEPQVVCQYCKQTLLVRGDGPANAPRVTIAAPPAPLDEVRLTIGIGMVGVLVAAAGLVAMVWTGHLAALLFVALGGTFAALSFIGVPRKRAYLREIRTLREQGIPGRATVRSLGAGQGTSATLVLDVDLGGQHRSVTHPTTIPMLLIPKVTSGCALPVLVHPSEPDTIEIQWHLL